MATGSDATADIPSGRSGGKILKSRKTATRTTPYDRPIPPQSQQSENPNWLTGLVSPAKFVAGGATKILSSFWNPKTWATPSSSSSEDSDSDSGDNTGDDENPSDSVIAVNQQMGSSSHKSETLHLIEQLLMLEQYSREECDRLIEIINSRAVNYSMRDVADAGPSMTHGGINNETPDIQNQAIMEAKKWIEENKVRAGVKSTMDNGIHTLKSVMTPQAAEVEAGSPVDVAKSYMKARPPWASPISRDNSLTPSPLAADLFKERTPYISGGGTSFSSTKRDYLSAGSWNIQDELRRVRSKATEDLLNSNRSVRAALSAIEHDTPKPSLARGDMFKGLMDRDEPITSETPKSGDETVNLAADESIPGLSDMRTAQNDLSAEALPSHPSKPVLEQYQGTHSDNATTRLISEGYELEKEDERDLDQGNDNEMDQVDKNRCPMTESADIPLTNNTQSSSNTNDHSLATKTDGTIEKRAATRTSRSSRRGRGKGN
uniref:protein KAKU4-like isoform X2 n=1 Tax=Erigeron canadensis TaxID=72917 RepID=UPI001CB932C2|nr:protein KAKU4-like isoform X2 [Erigeron canadensis]